MILLTIIVFAIILTLLVFVHELGHFAAARKFKVPVEEFGFGLPPRIFGVWKDSRANKWRLIWGKSKNQDNLKQTATIYSLNWIPVGGFVKIKGESGEADNDPNSFINKKIWQRFTILSAGVAMNLILAAIVLAVGLMIGLPAVIDDSLPSTAKLREEKIQIVEVAPNSPAANVGLKRGDIILSLDGQSFKEIPALQRYINQSQSEISLIIERGGEIKTFVFKPKKIIGLTERPVLGVGLLKFGIVSYPWYQALAKGTGMTFTLTWEIIKAFGELLKSLITGGKLSADVAGPVGIAVITGQVINLGFIYVLRFAALLSINLAILNFIPFPGLDGGRVLFLLFEKLLGRPISRQIENLTHNVGFALLLVLILLVTYHDISRFGTQILNTLKTAIGI